MKKRNALLSVLLALALIAPGAASDAHDDAPKYGGIVTNAHHVTYELVAKPDMIALHIRDHGKVVKVEGGTAKLTILNGSQKTEATLTPEGDALVAKGAHSIVAGSSVVSLISLPKSPTRSVRFAGKK